MILCSKTWCLQYTKEKLHSFLGLQQTYPSVVWDLRSRSSLPACWGSLHVCSLHCRPAGRRDTPGGRRSTSLSHTWQQSEEELEVPLPVDLRSKNSVRCDLFSLSAFQTDLTNQNWKTKHHSHAAMLSSSIWWTPNSWKLVAGILAFNDSVSMLSRDSVTLEVKLKACKHKINFFVISNILTTAKCVLFASDVRPDA